ncbi:MAG TPA: hypothetical protein VMW49_06795, partial [Candidatus Dormibacteraeota bacterium]|nr:hypothetical protein [Candidatus Dormibacteraeota bacterium]
MLLRVLAELELEVEALLVGRGHVQGVITVGDGVGDQLLDVDDGDDLVVVALGSGLAEGPDRLAWACLRAGPSLVLMVCLRVDEVSGARAGGVPAIDGERPAG